MPFFVLVCEPLEVISRRETVFACLPKRKCSIGRNLHLLFKQSRASKQHFYSSSYRVL